MDDSFGTTRGSARGSARPPRDNPRCVDLFIFAFLLFQTRMIDFAHSYELVCTIYICMSFHHIYIYITIFQFVGSYTVYSWLGWGFINSPAFF